MAIATPPALSIPLRTDETGVIRIGKTRVTLHSLVADFHRGASAEEIANHFPVLSVADVYLVVGYYLQNRAEVDEYIRQEKAVGEQHRQELASVFPQEGLRAKLLARMEAKKNSAE